MKSSSGLHCPVLEPREQRLERLPWLPLQTKSKDKPERSRRSSLTGPGTRGAAAPETPWAPDSDKVQGQAWTVRRSSLTGPRARGAAARSEEVAIDANVQSHIGGLEPENQRSLSI